MSKAEPATGILHDHYKDTFTHIREREKQRDRLFLIVIAALGALVLQLTYTAAATKIVAEVEVLGVKVQVDKVPMPVLLSTTWTLLAGLFLRYCQITIHVDKQYDYLHDVERRLSAALGMNGAISRESNGYLTKKSQWFRTFVWLFYIIAFPAVVILATLFSIVMEWWGTSIPLVHKWFDGVVAGGVVVLVGVYIAGVWFGR